MNSEYMKFVRSRMGSEKLDPLTHAMGIAGETGEALDLYKKMSAHGVPFPSVKEKLLNEFGDQFFYLYALCHQFHWERALTLGATLAADRTDTPRSTWFELYRKAAAVLSGVEEFVEHASFGYGIVDRVLEYHHALNLLVHAYGFTPEEAMAANVAKLTARYPNGFVAGGGRRKPEVSTTGHETAAQLASYAEERGK